MNLLACDKCLHAVISIIYNWAKRKRGWLEYSTTYSFDLVLEKMVRVTESCLMYHTLIRLIWRREIWVKEGVERNGNISSCCAGSSGLIDVSTALHFLSAQMGSEEHPMAGKNTRQLWLLLSFLLHTSHRPWPSKSYLWQGIAVEIEGERRTKNLF